MRRSVLGGGGGNLIHKLVAKARVLTEWQLAGSGGLPVRWGEGREGTHIPIRVNKILEIVRILRLPASAVLAGALRAHNLRAHHRRRVAKRRRRCSVPIVECMGLACFPAFVRRIDGLIISSALVSIGIRL